MHLLGYQRDFFSPVETPPTLAALRCQPLHKTYPLSRRSGKIASRRGLGIRPRKFGMSPDLQSLKHCPVVACTCLAAILLTLAWRFSDGDVSRLVMDPSAWSGEPWRLVTSCFLHVDPIHLIFNLYWIWQFGCQIEAVFGSLATVGMFLLLGAGSSAAQDAFSGSGVGLSGVGYGLFGFLWVLSRRDLRFQGTVDRGTVQIFVGWFFLCIILTITGTWHVGNVAHGAGALLGLLLGCAVAPRSGQERVQFIALLVASVLLIGICGTVARPYVNFAVFLR
jgi:membrane associated rhomboid family serine protease